MLALRFARRELRTGVRGLRIVLACLALGVAAIAAVGSLREGIDRGLQTEGRRILGGDLEIEGGFAALARRTPRLSSGRGRQGLRHRHHAFDGDRGQWRAPARRAEGRRRRLPAGRVRPARCGRHRGRAQPGRCPSPIRSCSSASASSQARAFASVRRASPSAPRSSASPIGLPAPPSSAPAS